jgi:hypothetical protein
LIAVKINNIIIDRWEESATGNRRPATGRKRGVRTVRAEGEIVAERRFREAEERKGDRGRKGLPTRKQDLYLHNHQGFRSDKMFAWHIRPLTIIFKNRDFSIFTT